MFMPRLPAQAVPESGDTSVTLGLGPCPPAGAHGPTDLHLSDINEESGFGRDGVSDVRRDIRLADVPFRSRSGKAREAGDSEKNSELMRFIKKA